MNEWMHINFLLEEEAELKWNSSQDLEISVILWLIPPLEAGISLHHCLSFSSLCFFLTWPEWAFVANEASVHSYGELVSWGHIYI